MYLEIIQFTWTLWPFQSRKFLNYHVRPGVDFLAWDHDALHLCRAKNRRRSLIDWKNGELHPKASPHPVLHRINPNYIGRGGSKKTKVLLSVKCNYVSLIVVFFRIINLPMRSNSSPPAAYSKKMYSISFWRRVPKYRKMCGCCKNFCMHTSFLTDADASGCFFVSTIFIATASPVCRFSNNLTLSNWYRNEMWKQQLISFLLGNWNTKRQEKKNENWSN